MATIGDLEIARGGMRGLFNRAGGSVFVCLTVLGGAAGVGIAAGFHGRLGQTPEMSSPIAGVSAADTVNLRFPADWIEAASPPPPILAFASADDALTLFDPRPTYPIIEARVSQPMTSHAAVEAEPRTQAAAPADAAPAKITLASASSKPAIPKKSNAVLNDSQIASIKKRLNLTPEQQRYWPAVEAELRKMEYKRDSSGKSTQGTRMASVDISKVNVEGLKSAGFPLVMSFSEEQKRELRTLTHLLGLDGVISTF
jgi:hypothetical protein